MRMMRLFTTTEIASDIKSGRRDFLRYDIDSTHAKRVHVGDKVRIVDYPARSIFVEAIVEKKQKINAIKPGDTELSCVICIWFRKVAV